MRTSRLFSALVVLALAACTGTSPQPVPPGEDVGSNLPRALSAAPSADLEAAVSGNTEFAFDLYRQLVKGNSDNLFYSPHSISVALAMTYGGSIGPTAAAFESTMHINLPSQRYHDAMNDLDQQLAARGQGATGADGQPFALKNTNQLFAQLGFSFQQSYLDLLATDYGSRVKLLDFVNRADPSRVSINDWVATATNQRITDLLAQGTVTPYTRAVLVNAIYFNASWQKQFDPHDTHNGDFHKLDGSTASVPRMHASTMSGAAVNIDGTDVVKLNYDGNGLSAILIAPQAGQLAQAEAQLSTASLNSMLAGLRAGAIDLTLPSFQMKTSEDLVTPLTAMGLGLAFSKDADFSGMSTAASLHVSDIVHQAFVKVDETGTEAAAATAVIVGTTSVELPLSTVVIDRPFIVLIRDNATGAIVFAGRVTSP